MPRYRARSPTLEASSEFGRQLPTTRGRRSFVSDLCEPSSGSRTPANLGRREAGLPEPQWGGAYVPYAQSRLPASSSLRLLPEREENGGRRGELLRWRSEGRPRPVLSQAASGREGSFRRSRVAGTPDAWSPLLGPPHQHLGRRQERAAAEKARKGFGRWLSPTPIEHGKEAEHGRRLLERGSVVATVASVPAERSSPEPRRLFGEDQKCELEGFCEPDVVELSRGSASSPEVLRVERSAEASIGRAAGGHGNACSQKRLL